MSPAELLYVNPILPTTAIETSISFYTRKLGFSVSFRDCSAPENYVGVRRGGVELHLQYQREEDMPKPGTLMIRMVVDDPHALFTEFESQGVFKDPRNHGTSVEEKPWGTIEFSLCDCNGHGLIFYRDR